MSYQIEFRHLRYFLTVAEELHFRKAAERLYISQPGLSMQIKQMEEGLGVQLFERHNRNVELTRAGKYLKEEISIYLKELNTLLNHAKMLQRGVEGDVRFGYVGSAMHSVIPKFLLKFNEKHPNVLVNLKEMGNQKQLNALFSKEIDVGFVRLERVPSKLKTRPMVQENFCLVLPEDHPLDKRNFRDLSQCKEESFIMFDSAVNATYYQKVMQIFDDSGFAPKVSHNTMNASSIFRLVENKLGISIVPKSLQNGYDMKVKFIELDMIPQKTTLSMIWNPENRNPVLKYLLEMES